MTAPALFDAERITVLLTELGARLHRRGDQRTVRRQRVGPEAGHFSSQQK